jgi:hypothetical protein
MMFGFGWLMMLFVIIIPILLVILLVAAAYGFLPNTGRNETTIQNPSPVYQPAMNSRLSLPTATLYCAHCGTGLKLDWSHCPQCGAPIQ